MTIYDIARESGVSYATVSRALNGHADVGRETKQRILTVTKQLGYRPRAIARGLTTKKSWLMGVAYHGQFDNPFFGRLLSRAKEALEPAGYELLFFHDPEGAESNELVQRADYRQIDGLLVAAVPQQSAAVRALEHLDIPIVSINFRMGGRSSSVLSHHHRGSRRALEHLWELGHRRIGFVAGDLDYTSGRYRYDAYITFLEQRSVPFRQNWIVQASFGSHPEDLSYRGVGRVLQSKEQPTAWFCSDDRMALGVLHACRDHGLGVPEQVSVVGFDDIDVAHYVEPALTTVRQDRETIGRESAIELLRLVQNPTSTRRAISVPTELVIRKSTGPAPSFLI